MKHKVITGSTLLLILVAAVLLLHPVKVMREDSFNYRIFITGTTTPVENFVPMAGGMRAYIEEGAYMWFSKGDFVQDSTATPFGVHWKFFWQDPILQMGRE